jgi:hypothetical protein
VCRGLETVDEVSEMGVAIRLATGSDGRDVDKVVWLKDDEPWVEGAINYFIVDDINLTARCKERSDVAVVTSLDGV